MPDFQYFYEYEVQIENPTYRGTQGKGRCPLGTHQDKKPSFSFSLDNVNVLAADGKATLFYSPKH